jgi:DNA-binding NarL/FixJ family response regulator
LDLLRELKQTHPHLPVLILSGYGEDEYAVRAIRAGAAGYLTKDRATTEVIHAVQKIRAGERYLTASVADKLAAALDTTAPQAHAVPLSAREQEVLRLIVAGHTLTQIAEKLSLSIKTVSTYRTRITEKTGFKTDAELTRHVLEHKLLD